MKIIKKLYKRLSEKYCNNLENYTIEIKYKRFISLHYILSYYCTISKLTV